MFVGDRQLGRQVPTGLIEAVFSHSIVAPHGRRDRRREPDLDEVRRHGVVSHQGMTSPAPFPFAVKMRRRYRPIWLVRAPAGNATSGPSACEMLGRMGFILPPQLYLDAFREPRPDLRQFGGGKSLDGRSFCAYVARPRRDLGEAASPQLAPDRGLDRASWRTSPRAIRARSLRRQRTTIDRRDRAGLNNFRQCSGLAVIGVELRGCGR